MTKRRTIEPIEADRLACRALFKHINRVMPAGSGNAGKKLARTVALKQCMDAMTACEELDTLYATRTLPPMPSLPVLYRNGVKLIGIDLARPKRKG